VLITLYIMGETDHYTCNWTPELEQDVLHNLPEEWIAHADNMERGELVALIGDMLDEDKLDTIKNNDKRLRFFSYVLYRYARQTKQMSLAQQANNNLCVWVVPKAFPEGYIIRACGSTRIPEWQQYGDVMSEAMQCIKLSVDQLGRKRFFKGVSVKSVFRQHI